MTSRRSFVATGLGAALAAAGLGGVPRSVLGQVQGPRSGQPLRILILGGTSFLGPHQIAYALERGHAVSTFTRGRTVPTVHRDLFERVEMLIGDRANDLEALRNREWDVVIDNSGREVSWTRDTAQLLKDHAGLYVYTSSTGVYYPYRTAGITEDTAPVLELPAGLDLENEPVYGYGIMKALSELEARAAFGDERTLVIRPTYIMGPGDPTDRFTYWPVRLARGGDVLVPGRPDDPVQYIDVRDLTEWTIRLAEEGASGTYNGVGPRSPTGMHQFVFGAHGAFGSAVRFVAVDDYEFLRAHRIGAVIPWIMPEGDNFGSARVSNARALSAGLTLRPLADSVRDIDGWWNGGTVAEERKTAFVSGPRSLMAREASILAEWEAR